MTEWKYLHKVNESCWRLDHRVTPEVSAMFSAMVSRLPLGGIEARYRQVVEAVAEEVHEEMYPNLDKLPWAEKTEDKRESFYPRAEDKLCGYPLHPVVQEFFDKFVGKYGHGSIKELTGQPAIFWEGISPFSAYLSFDNPLVSGQESSTRAVRHKDWPLCKEAFVCTSLDVDWKIAILPEGVEDRSKKTWTWTPHPELEALHKAWLEVFEAEVEAWKIELRRPCPECVSDEVHMTAFRSVHKNLIRDSFAGSPQCRDCGAYAFVVNDGWLKTCDPDGETYAGEPLEEWDYSSRHRSCEGTGKKYPFIKDPQSFRPALDRARWAIPSTIATACSHTGNLRTMSRVVADGLTFSATERVCPRCKMVDGQASGAYHVSEPQEDPDVEPVIVEKPCLRCGGSRTIQHGSKVWQDLAEAYDAALPGMAGMGMKEAVVGKETPLPGHLKIGFVEPGPEVAVNVYLQDIFDGIEGSKDAYVREGRNYIDPMWNQLVQVHIEFQCSWAVARDWHRHRTAYPWHLNIVTTDRGKWAFHPKYVSASKPPLSKEALAHASKDEIRCKELLRRSRELFEEFRNAGDMEKAMLCLPFGTLVSMRTTMGLRDAVYCLELRAYAHGSNWEYEAQALEALKQLKEQLPDTVKAYIWPETST